MYHSILPVRTLKINLDYTERPYNRMTRNNNKKKKITCIVYFLVGREEFVVQDDLSCYSAGAGSL